MTNRNPSKEGVIQMAMPSLEQVDRVVNGLGGAAKDMVNHPPHYCSGGVECIDAIRAALGEDGYRAWLRGNAIKYLWRCDKKHLSPLEDLKKAEFYVARLIKSLTE